MGRPVSKHSLEGTPPPRNQGGGGEGPTPFPAPVTVAKEFPRSACSETHWTFTALRQPTYTRLHPRASPGSPGGAARDRCRFGVAPGPRRPPSEAALSAFRRPVRPHAVWTLHAAACLSRCLHVRTGARPARRAVRSHCRAPLLAVALRNPHPAPVPAAGPAARRRAAAAGAAAGDAAGVPALRDRLADPRGAVGAAGGALHPPPPQPRGAAP